MFRSQDHDGEDDEREDSESDSEMDDDENGILGLEMEEQAVVEEAKVDAAQVEKPNDKKVMDLDSVAVNVCTESAVKSTNLQTPVKKLVDVWEVPETVQKPHESAGLIRLAYETSLPSKSVHAGSDRKRGEQDVDEDGVSLSAGRKSSKIDFGDDATSLRGSFLFFTDCLSFRCFEADSVFFFCAHCPFLIFTSCSS